METIAVYWEKMIRTYGLEVRRQAILARLRLPAGAPDAFEALAVDPEAGELLIATAHRGPSEGVTLYLAATGALARRLRERDTRHACLLAEVDVVFLHGPHYGDRYGIASAALESLRDAGVEVLLTSCAGASLHLAVAAGRAEEATAALGRAFVVPGAAGEPTP